MRSLALIAILVVGPANAFIAQNGLIVEATDDGFIVPWRGRSGASEFWCAAGDYAIRVLHLPPTDIIYRASPTKRNPGDGVAFTLDPAKAVEKTGLLILNEKIGGITAGFALHKCENRKFKDRG